MNNMTLTMVCIFVLGLGASCVADQHQDNGKVPDSIQQKEFVRSETICYTWQRFAVQVSFHRNADSPLWTMRVGDTWSVLYQTLRQNGEKKWGQADSKCSLSECLSIMDESLNQFHRERPTAQVEALELEMHVVRDLWSEVLFALQNKLPLVDGEKSTGLFEIPEGVEEIVRSAIDKSTTSGAVKEFLRNRGVVLKVIAAAEHVTFKDSASGRKWSDIAKMPGVGILAPGTVEFVFEVPK